MSIYQFVAEGVFDDVSQLRNIHHYLFADYVPNSTQLQEAVDELDAGYKSNLQADFVDHVDFSGYTVRRVDLGELPSDFIVPTAGTWSGTASPSPLPPQLSGLVSWKGPTAYPRTTRCFLWPFSTGSIVDPGVLNPTLVTRMGSFASDILVLSITGAADAIKVAVEYSGTPRVVSTYNGVDTIVVNNIFRTQRRRVTGVGI